MPAMSLDAPPPPEEFDDYKVLRPLGKGGMGRVYGGHDMLLDRPVAIKFIDDELPTAQTRQRFRVEAVALARLQHPNVMAVYRTGQVAGRPYIVGELVSGQSLDQLAKPLEWRRALDIALGLARGLSAVHLRGVLHRDLKPGNAILTSDGHIKLVDFGIAKLLGEEVQRATELTPGETIDTRSSPPSAQAASGLAVTASTDAGQPAVPQSGASPILTQAGARMGTPLYMSPEVWNGEPGTPRSDIYSLGAMLFELCSGRPPHQAETAMALGFRVTQTNAPSLAAVAAGVDGRLVAIIDRCLRRSPAERFASGAELCVALEQLQDRLDLRRRLLRVSVVALILILALGALSNALFGWLRTRRAVAVHVENAQQALAHARHQSSQVDALRSQAFAAFDARKSDAGEALWGQALEFGRVRDAAYKQATRELDAALLLDPRRREVRHQFAEALYAQAVLFDREHHDTQRDEVLARLAGYADVDREDFLMRWKQPAVLSLNADPPGATVTLSRYDADMQGRRSLRALGVIGATPLLQKQLEPGSYLIELSAANRVNVRVPILVARGEPVDLHVYLPKPIEVPPGFIYVPAGRALFGTDWEEPVRRKIFVTVPVHEIQTGSYLIARTETTFDEWIAFMNALPAEQREQHRPRSTEETAQGGSFAFKPTPDGSWQLTLGPVPTRIYTARLGQPIVYTHREPPQSIDWRRLPVVGIDRVDCTAYLKWLHDSGRVRGARLCTEHEWERAARGADLRSYPHGDFLAAADANIDDTHGRLGIGPDEVGSHPASRSPFGVDDLTGNVWEWVEPSLEAQKGDAVLRGGAYSFDGVTAQISNRHPVEPKLRNQRLGLRVCADFPRPLP